MRKKTPASSTRKVATVLAAGIVLATTGCFALFSLDGYGPLAEAPDGSVDADTKSDAAVDARDAAPPGRTIFVTSQTFTGDLGTRDGGDSKCQSAAKDAGLPGTYRAWLSEQGSGVLDRLVTDAGPLRLVNGAMVASSTADLAKAGPRTGIVLDERGTKRGGGVCEDGGLIAWTGTGPDGSAPTMFGSDCAQWRTSGGQPGLAGLVGSTDDSWTSACTRPCNQQAALYCIQQ
jgi:hypothetical protein